MTNGTVELLNSMGCDEDIADAARISYRSSGDHEKLIYSLMKRGHTTPFEQVSLVFHVKCPIFVARQWFRHRTFSYNEVSQRYTRVVDEFHNFTYSEFRTQHNTEKQMTTQSLIEVNEKAAFEAEKLVEEATSASFAVYQKLLELGVCREQARAVLPLNTFTEFHVSGNLHNWFRFLKLRTDMHSQLEMREYARLISLHIKQKFPISHEAWSFYNDNPQ